MIGKWVAVLLLASPAGIAAAQQPPSSKPDRQQSQEQAQSKDQQDALAAAARRAREQQKNQPRATKVWDNDNLPPTGLAVSVVGTGSTAAASDQGPAGSGTDARQNGSTAAKVASTKDQKADLQKQLGDAKAHLKIVQTDLDIATRTHQLDQQTFYSNPDHDSDTAGATKLKNEQSDVDAKKQEVADAQKAIDDLNAKLQDLESENAKSSNRPQ